MNSNNVIQGCLDSPKPAYSLEKITVKILDDQINKTFYYALKSFDDNDIQSPRSNIAPAGVYAAIGFEGNMAAIVHCETKLGVIGLVSVLVLLS